MSDFNIVMLKIRSDETDMFHAFTGLGRDKVCPIQEKLKKWKDDGGLVDRFYNPNGFEGTKIEFVEGENDDRFVGELYQLTRTIGASG
jgi:hypothetical protein